MRWLLTLLLIIALIRDPLAQVTSPAVYVPAGTEVEIELLQNVSSETLRAGQTIPFKLVRPLEVQGETLLAAGDAVTGFVEKVKASSSWGKSGTFNLRLQPLKLDDGTLVPIDFPRPHKNREKQEKAVEGTAATIYYTYYFPLIPVALIASARKGNPFNVRSGERYLVYVTAAKAPVATGSPKQ